MNQTIHFKTSLFDVSTEKENPINPIYGISLLDWLRSELEEKIDITEPDAEDWGWYSTLDFEGNHYLIGACAFFEPGDDPAAELEWVFQVDKYRSFTDKMLGRNKMNTADNCFVFFKRFFEKHPAFNDIVID